MLSVPGLVAIQLAAFGLPWIAARTRAASMAIRPASPASRLASPLRRCWICQQLPLRLSRWLTTNPSGAWGSRKATKVSEANDGRGARRCSSFSGPCSSRERCSRGRRSVKQGSCRKGSCHPRSGFT